MSPQSFRSQDIRALLKGGFSDEQIARFTGATWLAILAERGEAASAPCGQGARDLPGSADAQQSPEPPPTATGA